jgi:predicted RNase H-like nuclease
MTSEESEGIPTPVQHFGQRAAQAIGVRRFYSFRKHLESKEGAGTSFRTPGKTKSKSSLKSTDDELDESICVSMCNFVIKTSREEVTLSGDTAGSATNR